MYLLFIRSMLITPRVLITLFAALWLPVCHCQFTNFLMGEVMCCLSTSDSVQDHPKQQEPKLNCCAQPIKVICQSPALNDGECDHEQNHSHNAPCQSCPSCLTKAPPPPSVSIDLDALSLHKCLQNSWVASWTAVQIDHDIRAFSLFQNDPPGPPLSVNQRCAIHSHWII